MGKIQVKAPGTDGAWLYVKKSPEGLLFGIYPTNALEGESSLNECREQYPQLEFREVS